MNAKPTHHGVLRDLVLNGDFSDWPLNYPPAEWYIKDDDPPDPEITEVGSGEGHGGAGSGCCNYYTSQGIGMYLQQELTLVVGKRYLISIKCDTIIAGSLKLFDRYGVMFTEIRLNEVKTYTTIFTATGTTLFIRIARIAVELTDVTIDDISLKPVRPEFPV